MKLQKERMAPRATAGGVNGFIAGLVAMALMNWGVEIGPLEIGYITTGVTLVGGAIVSVIWPAIRARLAVPK